MYPVQFLSMSSCSGVDSSLSHCPYSYLQKILSHCRLAYYTCIFFNLFVLFIYYFWLCWVSVAARELSLVAVSGGYSSLQGAGFSLRWLLLLRSTGSRCAGFSSCGAWASVVVAHQLTCSAACGIFPDQSSNPCPLHWQGDS